MNSCVKMCLKTVLCVLLCLACMLHEGHSQEELPCPLDMSINIDDGKVFNNNGSILHNNIIYSADEYFLHNGTQYRGCICLVKHCLKKCCPHGSIFGDTTCEPSSDPRMIPFDPPVYNDFEHLPDLNTSEHFVYMYGVECNGRSKFPLNPLAYESDAFYLQYDGRLYAPEMGNYSHTDFCIELFLDQPKTGIPWPDNNPHYLAILCFEPADEEDDVSVLYIIFPIGLLISSPFLLATFCVYAFIPELRNLHGKCLMNYVFSLFVGFTSLATNQIISGADIEITKAVCEAIAFIIYFFFMLSFFWLNVMCIDIWLTFRGFKAPRIGRRSAEYRRFIFYCIYAWGCTFALTVICALLQYHPDVPSHVVKPNFGDVKCWFEDRTRELFFFYIPVIILVLSNLFLFSNTSLKIVQINKETAMLQTGDSTRHDQYSKDKQRFNLYLKLFLVMGINWTAELLSFIIGGNKYIWIFSDCLNTILGVYIFIIFVCKTKIKNLIIKRYRLIRYGSTSTQTRSSSRFRSTNVGMTSIAETDKSFVSETSVIRMKVMN